MPVNSFRVDDLDAAVHIGDSLFYEHRLKQARVGDQFELDLKVGQVGSLKVGLLRYGCEVTVEVDDYADVYAVRVPLRGGYELNFGNTEFTADPTIAGLTQPTSALTVRGWPTGTEQMLLIKFERAAVEAELSALLGREIVGPIRLRPSLDISSGAGRAWWQLAQSVVPALAAEAEDALHPLMTMPLSSAITTGLLLASEHQYREALEMVAKPARPLVVQRAMDIIEERAHEPLTISGVATEVGCSVRSLQVGFKKHLDTSPHEFLTRVRLDRAHVELVEANPGTDTVRDIAKSLGFTNLGRFASDYRKQYGAPPSATLRNR